MDKELLFSLTKKDFVVTPFRGTGNGGQKINKTMSCCRIQHPASGAVAEAREQRHFHQNKKVAFERLINKPEFQTWHKLECARRLGQAVDEKEWIKQSMDPKNLRIERQENGKWVRVEEEETLKE